MQDTWRQPRSTADVSVSLWQCTFQASCTAEGRRRKAQSYPLPCYVNTRLYFVQGNGGNYVTWSFVICTSHTVLKCLVWGELDTQYGWINNKYVENLIVKTDAKNPFGKQHQSKSLNGELHNVYEHVLKKLHPVMFTKRRRTDLNWTRLSNHVARMRDEKCVQNFSLESQGRM